MTNEAVRGLVLCARNRATEPSAQRDLVLIKVIFLCNIQCGGKNEGGSKRKLEAPKQDALGSFVTAFY